MTRFFSDTFVKVIQETEFPKLWASQILSQVSLHLINFVIILRIFEATGSSVAVGLVWLFYALPALILGPFSGTLIDLMSRRKLLVATNIAQAITVLFYLPAQEAIWPIYTVIFVYALLNQIFVPTEAATVPFLVPRDLLPVANTLFVFTVYASFLFGLGFAGPLVQLVGVSTTFVFVSIFLGIAAVAVAKLPNDERHERIERPNEFWERFVEGYEFIQEKPRVLFPLLLLVFSGMILPMIAILSPAIAVKILGIPLLETSVKLVVPTGIGAIIGGIVAVKLLKKIRKKQAIAAGLFLGSFAVLWLGVVVPNMENRVLFGALSAFLMGFAFATIIIPTQTLLQEKTPVELRGRIFGALSFLITLVSILPVLFAATLAEFFGESALLLFISAVLFVLAVLSLNSAEILKRYEKA